MMRGIDGIVVPRLDTGAQAAQVIDDVKYCCPNNFNEKIVIVQIESASAVQDLDAFLNVADIDCYFVGVVDLAKSMGFGGNYRAPEVVQALDKTIERILAFGKCAGIMVKENDMKDWQKKGVSMLYTHLNDFAAMGARHWRAIASSDESKS